MLDLVIATTNAGKLKEFNELLADLSIKLRGLKEFGYIPEVEETGATFAENAELKARYYALRTNYFALADDSGLEVEALSNSPGVYSARYAGDNATDAENIEKLLSALEDNENATRNARFVCEMAISDENEEIIYVARGICNGKIASKPCGGNGFGYDPIFVPTGFNETFGELSSEIKQQISHRSKAVKQIIEFLYKFCSS